MLNYEVVAGIYPMRKDHKLDEWRDFCKWIESLPYSEIITVGNETILYGDNAPVITIPKENVSPDAWKLVQDLEKREPKGLGFDKED